MNRKTEKKDDTFTAALSPIEETLCGYEPIVEIELKDGEPVNLTIKLEKIKNKNVFVIPKNRYGYITHS